MRHDDDQFRSTANRRCLLTRRAALGAAAIVPVALAWTTGQGRNEPAQGKRTPDAGRVPLPDFRRSGARDDRAALAAALATGRPVHLPAGGGSGPHGAYLLSAAPGRSNLVSGARISGDGPDRTVVRRHYGAGEPHVFFYDSGSANPAAGIADVRLGGFRIEDTASERLFAEHDHLLHLNGVSNLLIEDLALVGFRGDGLYLGSGPRNRDERHNVGVIVRRVLFDGIDHNNRNAISIIDGRDVIVEDCLFRRCTRPGAGSLTPTDLRNPASGVGMPGAIDIEPDDNSFAVIRDIVIRRCQFIDVGGAAIALLLRPNDQVTTPQRGIRVEDCIAEGCRIGLSFNGYMGRGALTGLSYATTIARNGFRRCGSPFIINGPVGLTLADNIFEDAPRAAEFGYTDYSRDCRMTGNRFERIGYAAVGGTNGLLLRNADQLLLQNNDFIDCGRADRKGGRAINLERGAVTRLRLIGNRFKSPLRRTTRAIEVTGAALDRSTFIAQDNQYAIPAGETPR